MKPIHSRSAQAFLFLIGSLFCLPAEAAPITVGDPSFEGNSITAGGYTYDLSPEWTGTNGSNNGSAFEEYITGFSAAGTDHLGMENNYDVWQDIGIYQANTAYTLTVAVGNRSGNTQVGNLSQYLLADSTGAIYATGTFDASTLAAQTFADAPALVFATPTNPAAIGKTLRILLRARGNGRSHFDYIRLDASPTIIPGAATVGNLTATNPTPASATLNGAVTDIGNAAPTITIFWGTTNGNASPGDWTNSVDLPGTYNSGFSTNITGLSPATTYYFTARATNSAGASWALPVESFETPATAPTVANTPATNIRATTATLAAQVTQTGGEPPAVTIYYGPSDGGTTPANWASSATIGTLTGNGSIGVSGLAHSTPCFFRAFAQNSGGGSWAPESATFSTLAALPAQIINDTATGITGTTATLRGEVMEDGNDAPVVTIFYGTADGGTNSAAWSYSALVGTESADFTRFVSNLTVATPYFFRCRATNAGGTSWAPESATFTTTALVNSTPVISEIHYHPADDSTLGPLPLEFIELHNPGDTAVDLSGWKLANAVTFTFPASTTLDAGGYLVIAENPATLLSKYGVSALGPWIGKLSSTGETVELRDASNILKDTVSYKSGFPWPTSADGAGPSMELINPNLDNDLGGSWRASGTAGIPAATYISPSAAGWKYKRGTAEASSPVEAWRDLSYNDSTGWTTAAAAFGYGSTYTVATNLNINTAMRGKHRTVYYRKSFTIATGLPEQLVLKLKYDDAYVAWINGVEVSRSANAPTGQIAFNFTASVGGHPATAWETIPINTVINGVNILRGGTNVLCVHSLNESLNSSDYFFDAELGFAGIGASSVPTPRAANASRLATLSVPPQIRQVAHTPNQPPAGTPVTITARITDPDGVGTVSLIYQTVDPGGYIPIKTVNAGTKLQEANPLYQTTWTTVPMVDNGSNGDAVPGDFIFTAVLPANIQTNRRLVRYKITFADSIGNAQSVPYPDDEQPNFAYFVYNGLPAWTGALRPSPFNGNPATSTATYPVETLGALPPYHLIASAADVSNSQYNGNYNGVRFRGTLVYDGVVYDHIEFKNRGIGSTYQSGKNKWNIFFNRARDLVARDNWGKKYAQTWNNLVLNANASPWAPLNRGSAGIEEAASARIFELAGNTNFRSHYVHWRVIDAAAEASPTDQFTGDLWGLYLAIEPTEGNFLDERGLPDGNVYAIEGNNGDKKHQGAGQPVDSSDWITFRDSLATAGQTEAWYRTNMDLDKLYTFMAINRLIGNVDVRPGDNYRYYHRTSDNKWEILAYDLDMQFIAAHHWGGTMDGVVVAGQPFSILSIMRHPALAREYRNRCREILSLLGSDGSSNGGQIGQLLNEYAAMIHPAGQSTTWANLDAAMWNLHPNTKDWSGSNSGQGSHTGNFFRSLFYDARGAGGPVSTSSWIRTLADPDSDGFSDFPGRVQWFVDFATNTYPAGAAPWVRKATLTAGSGNDPDVNRQKGYGFKYLEWETLYGGYADSRNEPTTPANTDFPAKPALTASGDPAFAVSNLTFTSSAFSDPQGAGTFAAWQWRIAEIAAPGIAGHTPGTPCKYEIETLTQSPEITTGPADFTVPLGVAEPGKTYRVRVRHKDNSSNWSYWSDPVQFGATAAPPGALIHYWNFNDTANLLTATQTIGGGTLGVTGTYLSGTGQDFTGINARNNDPAGAHLRVNDPLTAGTMLTTAIPTGGFENVIVKYETRRSTQGAGLQHVSYTLDGTNYTPFAAFTILDAAPVVRTLDFRYLTGAADNPLFGIRITFTQGDGGIYGNNRFDNLTVEADPLPGAPELIPGGDADWNIASNWASASVPNGSGALAIIGAPATANRAVTLTAPVTIGTLEMDNAASAFVNQIIGGPGITLAFDGGASPALLDVDGTAAGSIEFDVPGGTTLATDLRLDVSNIEGDPAHGALRLRETWTGPGGLIKQGLGTASLTGMGKTFAGAVAIEQGVLQISQPATPGQTSGLTVHPGGQLRLTSGNDGTGDRIHTFGGAISLAGSGRGAGVPGGEPYGSLGALRYQPDVAGINRALVTNTVTLTADATVHTQGPDNTLVLSGALGGTHALTKSGDGTLVLSGASPAFTSPIVVASGTLEANGDLSATPLQLAPGTLLRGSGITGPITGSGTVAPHLTTLTAASSAAPACEFLLGNTGASGNSLLRLTDSAPFPIAPISVDLFINLPARAPGDRIFGGLFTPAGFDLAAALGTTQVRLLVPDPGGTVSHLGVNYRVAIPADQLTWSVVDRSADFGSGTVAGRTIEISVGGVPTEFTQWRNLFFPNPADLANDAISGPNANPSGDGVANLIRYAHGVGPFDPVIHLMPALVKYGSAFDFRFRYDATKTDLIWQVKATNDLGDWPAVLFDSQTTLPIPPLVDGWLGIALPDHLGAGPATDPEMFTRLEVRLVTQ